jgi:hypothetical protein
MSSVSGRLATEFSVVITHLGGVEPGDGSAWGNADLCVDDMLIFVQTEETA